MLNNVEGVFPEPKTIIQIAWNVEDIDTAVQRWVTMMGAGPFYAKRHITMPKVTYRGKPSTWDHSAAVGWWGNVEVELMQQHCDSPTALRDQFAPGETGLASVTWFVDDIHAEIEQMERMGFPTVHLVEDERGVPVAWFDTRSILDTMAEVYQDEPQRRARKAAVRRAAQTWDGSDPLRPIEDLVVLPL